MWSELVEHSTTQSSRLKTIYTRGYGLGMVGRDASLLQGCNFLPKPNWIHKLAQSVLECLHAPRGEIDHLRIEGWILYACNSDWPPTTRA